jgi:hypothetical protein
MIIEEFEKIGENFENAHRKVQYFGAVIYSSLYLSNLTVLESKVNSEFKKLLDANQEISQTLEKFQKWTSKFDGPEDLDKTIIEKSFVDKFQTFESLLFELIFSLFKYFPKFLSKGENFTGISFDELFAKNNIEDIRFAVAENRTRQLIQFNSTQKTLRQIEKIFGIEFNISEETLKQINLISMVRNLIVHNRSMMTEMTLRELNSENILIGVTVGQSVIPFIKNQEAYLDNVLWSTGNEILHTMKLKSNQIAHYHNSKL